MWYDKYFHWYQRKNVFDVYLDKRGDSSSIYLMVVLKTGVKGERLFSPITEYLQNYLQDAYNDAIDNSNNVTLNNDYCKYLKPTLGTTRPDPLLVSNIEKGFFIER